MDKSELKALLRIHDADGEFQMLLMANGFQVGSSETELIMCLAKWFRMSNNGEKIPPMEIKSLTKFREYHIEFLQQHAQEQQVKKQAEAKAKLEVVPEDEVGAIQEEPA